MDKTNVEEITIQTESTIEKEKQQVEFEILINDFMILIARMVENIENLQRLVKKL